MSHTDTCIAVNEGVKFWLNVLTELKDRGLNNILFACIDGLKGFSNPSNTVYRHGRSLMKRHLHRIVYWLVPFLNSLLKNLLYCLSDLLAPELIYRCLKAAQVYQRQTAVPLKQKTVYFSPDLSLCYPSTALHRKS